MTDVLKESQLEHPRWQRLLERGIDPEEVDLRRCGDALMINATAHLQNAVEAVASEYRTRTRHGAADDLVSRPLRGTQTARRTSATAS
jgi:hypothetical protein